MQRSGYVLAGFDSLCVVLNNFINGVHGRFNNNFTPKDISNFLSTSMSGFLHSYGQDFPGKKNYSNYNKREGELYIRCRDMGFFDDCAYIADSGGFQISVGRLTRIESDLLYKMYYEWLVDYKESYNRAFILDIPPGPGCEIFHDFEDVFKLNLESYQKAKDLPDEVRKKMIYVHHFRTPALWHIYTKIMREYDMFNSFEYHATGGIVANQQSDMIIPCIIYVLPLIPLINEAKKYGRDYLNFHVLGGANFRDIFFYELFTKVVKEKHNFDLNITFDSSGIFKQVMHARFMYAKDELGNYKKLNMRSNNIQMKFLPNLSVEDATGKILNEFARRWGFKEITTDGIYDPSRNTFWEDIKVYSMLYTLDLYRIIQDDMRVHAARIYDMYECGDTDSLYRECGEVTQVLNQGNLTKKQMVKSYSIPRSLDMLTTLDEDKCYSIVKNYLSKDEFADLDIKTRVLKS